MNLGAKEWEARIELIRSIAKSQEAMARILASIADLAEHAPNQAKQIRSNIETLSAMQLTMAEMATGVRIRRTQQGHPATPFIRRGIYSPSKQGTDE